MTEVTIETRNTSGRAAGCRRDALRRLAARILAGQGMEGAFHVSVLFCDDGFIAGLNREYRGKRGPTDVLSFGQDDGASGPEGRVLGDIVISMDTVAARCAGDPAAMRAEVRLLFCHGLLHLLGHDHGNAAERRAMQALQARYLGVSDAEAWRGGKAG